MIFELKDKNVRIEANEIILGENISFGNDIDIRVRGIFKLGSNSRIGDRFTVKAENCEIGEYFYNNPTDSRGMKIGGGSSHLPFANLKIGDRVTCHTGHINLARPVTIGNDVGLSHDVDIITHGFWASVLEGYPQLTKGVTIGNNVIVGWKTIIMMGIDICDDVVIGSHATVVKDITTPKSIHGGTPAKLIGYVNEPENPEKIFDKILTEFINLVDDYYIEDFEMTSNYPNVTINELRLNLIDKTCEGEHDIVTDAFRDHLRRYGIRIFHPRGFGFKLTRK